jgi:hypothetical protein
MSTVDIALHHINKTSGVQLKRVQLQGNYTIKTKKYRENTSPRGHFLTENPHIFLPNTALLITEA